MKKNINRVPNFFSELSSFFFLSYFSGVWLCLKHKIWFAFFIVLAFLYFQTFEIGILENRATTKNHPTNNKRKCKKKSKISSVFRWLFKSIQGLTEPRFKGPWPKNTKAIKKINKQVNLFFVLFTQINSELNEKFFIF